MSSHDCCGACGASLEDEIDHDLDYCLTCGESILDSDQAGIDGDDAATARCTDCGTQLDLEHEERGFCSDCACIG